MHETIGLHDTTETQLNYSTWHVTKNSNSDVRYKVPHRKYLLSDNSEVHNPFVPLRKRIVCKLFIVSCILLVQASRVVQKNLRM